MTVSTTIRVIRYAGDDAETTFPYTFRILNETDMNVVLTDGDGVDTSLTLTTHFSVTGVGEETGGNVEMVTPPATGEQLTLYRVTPQTQQTEYESNSPFPAETHETALDKLTMEVQELTESMTRTVTIPISDDTESMELPNEDTRANTYFYWDENGEPTTTTGTSVGGDHGALNGLDGDDHPQYHNNTRGDIRYYTKTQMNAGQMDTRYYTETEIDATLTGYYTSTQVDTLVTTVSGDILTYVSNNYVDNTEMTTISGDIITYVDTNYYTQTETDTLITTVSGDIITYLDTNPPDGVLLADGTVPLVAEWDAGDVIIADDHGAAATDQVVNVCYGTGDPPAAGTVTEGALYIKYVA